METTYYTGIGSRTAPEEILKKMTQIASLLELSGLVLRSGGASGSDEAFSRGVVNPRYKQIYLPFTTFNHHGKKGDTELRPGYYCHATKVAYNSIGIYDKSPIHVYQRPGLTAIKSRDYQEVMGIGRQPKSKFVLCYCRRYNGELKGETAYTMDIARKNNIPVFNLAEVSINSFKDYWRANLAGVKFDAPEEIDSVVSEFDYFQRSYEYKLRLTYKF